MKKRHLFPAAVILAVLVSAVLSGCSEKKPDIRQPETESIRSAESNEPTESMELNKSNGSNETDESDESALPPDSTKRFEGIERVGQVPDEFQSIVARNAFRDVTAFQNVLLKAEAFAGPSGEDTVEHRVQMMDLLGVEQAVCSCLSDPAYHVSTLTATEDGGFLFVLGFRDYALSKDVWASDGGYASRVIKCDKTGNLQFDVSMEGIEGRALEFCYEKNGVFYLFGTTETPETKTRGVSSCTDIYAVILNSNGTVIKNSLIAGSDFDRLNSAEIHDGGFLLSISSQSSDGDFRGSHSGGYPVDWVFVLDDDLRIQEKKLESGREHFDRRIGEVDGVPIYRSSDLLNGFDAGTPQAVIDYGNYYLIISENIMGTYEKTPAYLDVAWFYTETVYSAYTKNRELLFRTSVDSTPDYEAIIQELEKRKS